MFPLKAFIAVAKAVLLFLARVKARGKLDDAVSELEVYL